MKSTQARFCVSKLRLSKLRVAMSGLFGAAIGFAPLACAHDDASGDASAAIATPLPELVPRPAQLRRQDGEFVVDASTQLYANNAEARAVAQLFRDELAAIQGL